MVISEFGLKPRIQIHLKQLFPLQTKVEIQKLTASGRTAKKIQVMRGANSGPYRGLAHKRRRRPRVNLEMGS